jgi:hypothetical protein
MLKYTKETTTVRKFIEKYHEIDCYPEHQRLSREPVLEGTKEPSKAQSIINCLLLNMDIGQITLRTTPGDNFEMASIDGGHRKRYIHAFFQNRFKTYDDEIFGNLPPETHGKLFRELSPEMKAEFLARELTFCVYDDITDEENAFIFQSLNKTTQVNHQEMLNSYGKKPIAKAIRETVRLVPGIGNTCHSLFEYHERHENDIQTYTKVGFNNIGLRIDEMVARIFYRYYDGGGLGVCGDKDLEKMYQDNISISDCQVLKKKVWKCLNFIELMTQTRRRVSKNSNLLPKNLFVLFSRIYLYLEERFGMFNIPNENDFFKLIEKAYAPYLLVPYPNQIEELQQISPLSSEKTIGKQFNDCLGEYRPIESVKFPIDRIMNSIDILSVITPLDPKRIFPRAWCHAKLIEQNYKCAISGETIDLNNSQGGHNIAWSLGGRTDYNNLVMISTKHNKAMGTLSVSEYKSVYDSLNKNE